MLKYLYFRNKIMDLDDLCNRLVEYKLVDKERFNPNFTERIMREGGGVSVIQNQDSDITANINLLAKGLERCIQVYGPEKVEAFFYLQELANHARVLFYQGVNKEKIKHSEEDGKKTKRRFTEEEREGIFNRIENLKPGFYTSNEIGKSLDISAKSIGGLLSHLEDTEKEELRIKYDSEKGGWQKY